MRSEVSTTDAAEHRTARGARRRTVTRFYDFVAIYVFWGASFVAVKEFVKTIPPLAGASIRYAVAGAVLALVIAARPRRARVLRMRELTGAAFLGALLLGGGVGLLTVAAPHVKASISALLYATVPLWLVGLEIAVRRKWPPPATLTAAVVGVAGVGLIVADGASLGESSLVGILLVLAGAGCWAVGTFFVGAVPTPSNFTLSLCAQTVTAAALLGVAAAAAGQWSEFTPGDVSAEGWTALAFAAIAGSVLAYGSYQRLLRHYPPEVVSTNTFVNPLVAVLIAALLLGERLTATQALGAALVVGAVAALALRSSSTPPGSAQPR